MGKSKSHTSGLVPNFRTGRIDSKLAVSKNCRTLKSCSLNTEGYDNFGVPLEVFSLSKMSRIERKNLKLRLKLELEQVRKFLKKVASVNSNLLPLSSSSDMRSCSNRQKRSKLASQHGSLEVSAPQAKKRAPLGHNGPKKNRSIEPMKHAAQVTSSNATLMKRCQDLLDFLMSHEHGWVFNTPVDIIELEIPDYFSVIKHPMDLGTVKSRITASQYSSPMDFAADVRLTFSNAMIYNPPGNEVHIMAKTLSKYFEMRWKAIEKKIPVTNSVAPKSSKPTTRVETKISDQLPPLKKKKIRSNDTNVKPEPVIRIMTDDEKHKLSLDLEALLEQLPSSIANFLKKQSYCADETNDEIEIDIDALSEEALVQLRKLLDDYMLEKQKVQEIAEPCEVELPNESLQLCIGNEPVEEDVDILGGSDVPVLSFPAVAIEKDGATANRNRRCSNSGSSSSSSSESGSSSNGSDLSSSSGSESDTAKPPSDLKENVGSGLTLDPGKRNHGDSETRKDSMNMIGQVKRSSYSKAIGAEGCLEGESASERQVSPEKLSRAALLKSRFADTILKAKEKALEKDPHKPIIRREQLERRQRAEKAQLQAEAKAAEEAQRKAEAEAAAEAKRKRAQEREAARQALENMEKTVDINENCQLLKDLEMLGVVHDVQVGRSNPLEQLRLYLKLDEDEDENEELLQPTNGAEEGEIG